MKISKQLGWMIGLGLLSFTLVGVGTTSKPREAQAAAESAPVCRPSALVSEPSPSAMVASVVPQGVGTGGAAGSGPPLNSISRTREFQIAATSSKASASATTELVFFPLWARQ